MAFHPKISKISALFAGRVARPIAPNPDAQFFVGENIGAGIYRTLKPTKAKCGKPQVQIPRKGP